MMVCPMTVQMGLIGDIELHYMHGRQEYALHCEK